MIVRQIVLRQARRSIRNRALHTSQRVHASETSVTRDSNNANVQPLQSLSSATGGSGRGGSRYNPALEAQMRVEADQRAEEYILFQKIKEKAKDQNMFEGQNYKPHELITNPPKPSDVTLELLLASQAHLGHSTSLWNPANARYIFGIREGIHIISLEQTAAHLRRAARVVEEVTRRAGIVLFVGTRKGQDRAVVRAAQLAGACHLFERWIPGSITNGNQILGNCKKKVVNEEEKEIEGFVEELRNLPPLKPDLVVCMNPLENWVLLHECAIHNIPTIGVIDTDANPAWVTYPIPANDDSLRCIAVIAGVLGRAGQAGLKARLEMASDKSRSWAQRLQHQTAEYYMTRGQAEDAKMAAKSEILDELRDEKDRNTLLLGPSIDAIEFMRRKKEEKMKMDGRSLLLKDYLADDEDSVETLTTTHDPVHEGFYDATEREVDQGAAKRSRKEERDPRLAKKLFERNDLRTTKGSTN